MRQTNTLVDLYIDGKVISTTGEHPFWTPDKGWVEASYLQVGSLLQTEDGRIVDLDGIEKREGEFEVYNFSVEGFHTYFVSDLGVLVHNARYRSKPDPNAQGPHTVFTLDSETGKVRHYETFRPKITPHPQDPHPWQSDGRFDRDGKSH